MLTLKTGQLAYFDGLRGPLPCKVIAIDSVHRVTVEFTTNRIWRRGQRETVSGSMVFPRKALSRRSAMMGRILPYVIQPDA